MLFIGLWMGVGGYTLVYYGVRLMQGRPVSFAELLTGKPAKGG